MIKKKIRRKINRKRTTKYHQGRFSPKNPEKWINSQKNIPIIFRSSYERKFCSWLDMNDSVLLAGSEVNPVPYFNPVKRRNAIYFPDFYMKIKDTQGNIKEYMIEVKPEKETRAPIRGKKQKSKSAIYEKAMWMINYSKWRYAEIYCKQRGWIFKLVTERELGIR